MNRHYYKSNYLYGQCSSFSLHRDEILQQPVFRYNLWRGASRPARGYIRVGTFIYLYMNTYLRLERVRGIIYLCNTDGAEDSLIPSRSDRFLVPRDPAGHIYARVRGNDPPARPRRTSHEVAAGSFTYSRRLGKTQRSATGISNSWVLLFAGLLWL